MLTSGLLHLSPRDEGKFGSPISESRMNSFVIIH